MPCIKKPATPGCGGPGTMNACGLCKQARPSLMSLAGSAPIMSAPTTITHAHTGTITQNNTIYNGSWNVSFSLSINSRTRHEVTVTVDVYAHGSGVTDEDKGAWKNQIVNAWSRKFKFVDANVPPVNYWTVLFDIAWRGAGVPAYDVTVAPPASPYPATMTQREINLAASNLPEGKPYRDQIALHRDQPTQNMGVWGKGDMQAVLHEFGHMIGCPDEYTLISCSSTPAGYVIPYSPAYNVAGYSTDSIMNNPNSSSKIYERHLTYVRRVFEAWANPPLKPAFAPNGLRTVKL